MKINPRTALVSRIRNEVERDALERLKALGDNGLTAAEVAWIFHDIGRWWSWRAVKDSRDETPTADN